MVFARLFARWRSHPAAPPPAPPGRRAVHANPTAPAPTAPPWRLLARGPLLDARGAIAGWQLRLAAPARERHARSGAPAVLRELHAQALAAGAHALAREGVVLVDAPADLAGSTRLAAALPATAVLALRAPPADAAPLRAARLRIAASAASGLRGDFELCEGAAALALRRHGGAPRIALGLAGCAQLEIALAQGCTWVGGDLRAAARPATRREPAPATRAVARMLAAMQAQRPPRELAALIQSDVGLAWRLLRFAQGAAWGQARPAGSALEAVQLLGERELQRWLTAQLLSSASPTPLAAALQRMALARGRLLELLAEDRGEPGGPLFMLGAFSQLEALLDVPLEAALAGLGLPEAALDALIAESGPWRPYLDAALALEADAAAPLEASAAALGFAPDHLRERGAQAADWAASSTGQFAAR